MPPVEGHSSRSKANIARRFTELIEEDPALLIGEAARQLGVTMAILRACCRSCFDMSPTAYRRHQRLGAVRRILQQANPGEVYVFNVAADHGFYQIGKFSVLYRKTFGEKPSMTLAQRAVSVE